MNPLPLNHLAHSCHRFSSLYNLLKRKIKLYQLLKFENTNFFSPYQFGLVNHLVTQYYWSTTSSSFKSHTSIFRTLSDGKVWINLNIGYQVLIATGTLRKNFFTMKYLSKSFSINYTACVYFHLVIYIFSSIPCVLWLNYFHNYSFRTHAIACIGNWNLQATNGGFDSCE